MNMNKQTTYLKGLISAYNFYNCSENKEYILLKKKQADQRVILQILMKLTIK